MAAIARRLPLATIRAFGRALGSFAWHVARSERRKALANIAAAFPEWPPAKHRDTIRAMFRHLGATLLEMLWLEKLDAATRTATTTFENDEPIAAIFRSGRGVVAITAHCGNWEWLAYCVSTYFAVPVSVMQRERNEADLNRFLVETRAHAGIKTIDRGSATAGRELIQAVKRAGFLAFLIDQNIRAESAKVPFFGRGALTPIGPAKLAIRTGAMIVTAFIQRMPNGQQHIRFNTPIETKRDDDPIALTARLTADIEEQIRRAPEQWVWMHDRYRERPKYEVLSPES
jgi:KDO2-lipid IV(A) lauroyltransferase